MMLKEQRNSIVISLDGNWKSGLEQMVMILPLPWIISTTDSKGNKASIGGGMMKRQDQHHQHITNFIDVNSVDEYSSKIDKLGGKVVVSKMAVPGMGYFAVCHDTENNSFGIWESNESAK
jgi:uncharacterized protein